MKVIIPNELTLLSCSIAESDAEDGDPWAIGATYAKGAKVRHEHVIYTSLDDGNVGNDPSKTWSGTDARWKKVGATMPWRMLDAFVETQSRASKGENLAFCVDFNRADAFALLNMEGFAAHASIHDLDETDDNGEPVAIWEGELDMMRDIFHLSLFEYNYSPLSCVRQFARTDLPMPINGRLCVELEPGSQDFEAAIGHVVAGRQHTLGWTKYDVELGFTDYSKKLVDEFGVTTLVRRSFASTASLPLYLHPDQMDYVAETLASVRGIPCLWLGDNADQGHQSLTVYGWLEDFRMVVAGPNEIQLALEIQGLI